MNAEPPFLPPEPPLPSSLSKGKPGGSSHAEEKRKSKHAILYLVLGALLILMILAGGIAYRLVSGFLDFAAHKQQERPHVVAAPKYEPLFGEGLAGSGFHFQVGDSVYVCTSFHQFDGATPKTMMSVDLTDPIEILGVVHKQDDVQVLSFKSDQLRKMSPLLYDRSAHVVPGLPVYIYADSEIIKGHILSINEANGKLKIRTEKSFPAEGLSGGPIVSGETGTVIGVLIGANSSEHATRIEAEWLRLPEKL